MQVITLETTEICLSLYKYCPSFGVEILWGRKAYATAPYDPSPNHETRELNPKLGLVKAHAGRNG